MIMVVVLRTFLGKQNARQRSLNSLQFQWYVHTKKGKERKGKESFYPPRHNADSRSNICHNLDSRQLSRCLDRDGAFQIIDCRVCLRGPPLQAKATLDLLGVQALTQSTSKTSRSSGSVIIQRRCQQRQRWYHNLGFVLVIPPDLQFGGRAPCQDFLFSYRSSIDFFGSVVWIFTSELSVLFSQMEMVQDPLRGWLISSYNPMGIVKRNPLTNRLSG